MSGPLFKRNMKQLVKPLIAFFLLLGMYYGVVVYMYDPKLMQMLDEYQKLMPGLMAAVGMTGVTDTLLKFMNTYLYGFLMMMFPLIFLIMMGNHYLMDYEDSGSLACLLATPNSRKKIITTQAVSLILAVFLLMGAVTVMGIVFAELMFPGELDVKPYLMLNVGVFLLQLSISGIIFLAACLFQDKKFYYIIGCGIPLVSYLFSMLGNMGDSFSWMNKISLYSLFPSARIVAGENFTGYLIVLAIIASGCYMAGSIRFCKKNLFL